MSLAAVAAVASVASVAVEAVDHSRRYRSEAFHGTRGILSSIPAGSALRSAGCKQTPPREVYVDILVAVVGEEAGLLAKLDGALSSVFTKVEVLDLASVMLVIIVLSDMVLASQ